MCRPQGVSQAKHRLQHGNGSMLRYHMCTTQTAGHSCDTTSQQGVMPCFCDLPQADESECAGRLSHSIILTRS